MPVRISRKIIDRLRAAERNHLLGGIMAVSVACHVIVLVSLPSIASRATGGYQERSMEFDSRNAWGRRDASESVSGIPALRDYTALDRISDEHAGDQAAPRLHPDSETRLVTGKKLQFADKVGRREGESLLQGPRFMDLVRRRISESCEKHMTSGTRVAGIDRMVVLAVTILPSGKLESVDVIESSTISMVDEASVEAVKLAAPFPRFPTALKLPRLRVRVPIRYVLGEGNR